MGTEARSLPTGFFLFISGHAEAKTLQLTQQVPHFPPGRRCWEQVLQPRTPTSSSPAKMLRQWSVQSGQASGQPEPEPAGEELWEQEMERLCSSRAPVRSLPYAMVDKRFIRWVPGSGHSPGGQWAGGIGVEITWRCSAWPGWSHWVTQGRPHHHPIPGRCGSPRGRRPRTGSGGSEGGGLQHGA